MLSNVNLDIDTSTVIVPNIINGFSMGFIFVPLSTIAMGTLRNEQIGSASGLLQPDEEYRRWRGDFDRYRRFFLEGRSRIRRNLFTTLLRTMTLLIGCCTMFRGVGAGNGHVCQRTTGVCNGLWNALCARLRYSRSRCIQISQLPFPDSCTLCLYI